MQLLAIIVLYNCKAEDSKTLNSLIDHLNETPSIFENFRIIIYDNGVMRQEIDSTIPFKFQYVHDPSNRGLAVAYNYALNKAVIDSCDWLLLFDQDSCVPRDFIGKLMLDLDRIQAMDSVVAVVPKMRYKNIFFSPSRVLFGGVHRPINMGCRGIYESRIFAIGSGSVIRVSFLKKIKGFNELFWMDCLDRWLFHTIETEGRQVFVSDSIIDHELSIMDYDQFMNVKRYSDIMKYETIFMKLYKSKAENYVYYMRLLKRTVFLFFTSNNREYSMMTMQHLLSILFSRGM